jgi:hypothetical protein
LREKRSRLRSKLDKIKDSGDDVFEDIKADSEKLWKDVKKGFSEIREIVKE